MDPILHNDIEIDSITKYFGDKEQTLNDEDGPLNGKEYW